MAAAHSHPFAWLAGLGVAGLGAYEFLWKPWQVQQAAAALAATTGAGLSTSTAVSPLNPLSMLSTPSILPAPTSTGTAAGSITDPRVSPGGDVGQAMWRKNWTQTQAQTRLDALKQAYATSVAAIQALQANTANPAAAGIPASQYQLQLETAAYNTDLANYRNSVAAGNTADANLWQAAAAAHLQDMNELNARIAAASQPVDNSAAIAQYQGAIAGFQSQYAALTGMALA